MFSQLLVIAFASYFSTADSSLIAGLEGTWRVSRAERNEYLISTPMWKQYTLEIVSGDGEEPIRSIPVARSSRTRTASNRLARTAVFINNRNTKKVKMGYNNYGVGSGTKSVYRNIVNRKVRPVYRYAVVKGQRKGMIRGAAIGGYPIYTNYVVGGQTKGVYAVDGQVKGTLRNDYAKAPYADGELPGVGPQQTENPAPPPDVTQTVQTEQPDTPPQPVQPDAPAAPGQQVQTEQPVAPVQPVQTEQPPTPPKPTVKVGYYTFNFYVKNNITATLKLRNDGRWYVIEGEHTLSLAYGEDYRAEIFIEKILEAFKGIRIKNQNTLFLYGYGNRMIKFKKVAQ